MKAAPFHRTVEPLETRRMLSSAALSASGQLRIVGENRVNDVVTVGLNAKQDRVEVFINGDAAKSFAKSAVKSVAFYGKGGDDTFSVSETSGAFGIKTRFFGGDGNDLFKGGGETDWAYGEAGDDTLVLGDGANIAYGGAGNDTVTAGGGRDVIFGNSGNDTIDAGTGRNVVRGGEGDDVLIGSTTTTTTASTRTGRAALALSKVYVVYNGTGDATIINPYSTAGIAITATGGTVNVTGASGLSNIEYNLLGTSTAGSLTMSSTTSAILTLTNLDLTSATGPAIRLTGGQAHTFRLATGSTNALSDSAANAQNGTIRTDGKVSIIGAGALSIKGVKQHGISTSSSVDVQTAAVTITSAVSDGIHSEGFSLGGGSVTVAASGADGVDAGDGAISITDGTLNVTSTAADVKALKTGNNTITLGGGTLNLNVSGNASKAVSAKGVITATAGTVGINLSGAAILAASGLGVDPSYAAGIKSDGAIHISGGNFTVTATSTATGAKGISSGGDLNITGGTFNMSTAAASGTYTNTSGVADSYSASSFNSDAAINVAGGNLTVTNTGKDGKGFSADTNISVTAGTIGVTNSGVAGRGFDADGNASFTGGTSTVNLSGATVLTASGTGFNPSYPTGVKADGTITVSNTGSIGVTGTPAATGARGLSADTGISVTGGTVTTNLAGNGAAYTTSTGVKDAYKSAGLSSDTTINVSGGTVNLTSSGTAGRGMNADGNITFAGGQTTINLSGATLLSASGSGNDPSYPTGVKGDGTVFVNSGSLSVTGTAAATGARGISAGIINVSGGSVTTNLAGSGTTYTNSTGAIDSYAAASLSADTNLVITGGTVTTVNSGAGGKGLKSDGTLTIGSATTTPTVNLTTTGARFLQSGSGSTVDYNHPKTIVASGAINIIGGNNTLASTDDGIHSDVSITVSGGNNKVTASSTTQGVGEGIEAPIINFSGGTTNVVASNDGINSTKGLVVGGDNSPDGSQLNISGGVLIVTGADAIDANGDITITGGVTIASGPSTGAEEDVDFNGNLVMNGGILIGGGSVNQMTRAAAASSTQVSLFLKSSSVVASTSLIHVRTAAGVEIATFKPKNNNYYFHVSTGALAKSTQYQVYYGGTYTGGSYVGNSVGWGLYTGGTYSTTGATLKSTFTTSASSTTNTFTY